MHWPFARSCAALLALVAPVGAFVGGRAPVRSSAAVVCEALPGGPAFTAEMGSCADAVAIDPAACEDARDSDVWVVVSESAAPPSLSLAAAMEAATTASPTVVAAGPAAVGRLRARRGAAKPVIDVLRTSIPKEQLERCNAALAAVLERLVAVWLESLGDGDHFEDLRASGTIHTAATFESFGFAELDFPDLTALGRGDAIETHAARLPAAILAFDARAAASPVAADLAATLRRQPPPPASELNPAPEQRDPWAGAKFTL